MPNIDVEKLITDILAAATGAAKGHADDLKNYLEARAKIIADGVKAIVKDRLENKIDDNDVRFAFDEIKESAATSLLAIDVTLKAAAQDAINAALDIAGKAITAAIGIAII
jgi:hypothetical protein